MLGTALLALGLAAHAGPALYYEVGSHNTATPLSDRQPASLRSAVEREMDGRIKHIERQDEAGKRVPVQVADLGVPELTAAILALTTDRPGAEFDVWVDLPDGERAPVTVWWDSKTDFALRRGPAVPPRDPGDVTAEALVSRFGVAGFVDTDAEWDAAALSLVAESLSVLSPAELATVRDVPFHRVAEPRRGRVRTESGYKEQLAAYAVDDAGPRIEVYSRAVAPHGEFVGTPEAPRSRAVFVIVHELGHALGHAEARRERAAIDALFARHDAMAAQIELRNAAYEAKRVAFNRDNTTSSAAALRAELREIEALIAENNAIVSEVQARREAYNKRPLNPATQAMQKVLGSDRAPTSYGTSHPEEAFADAFSLFRTDPAALQRASPKVHAWFAADKHLKR